MTDRVDVVYINRLFAEIASALRCKLVDGKGRTIVTHVGFNAGDLIFNGRPLHVVCEDMSNKTFRMLVGLKLDLEYEPIWYWCALNSFTEDDKVNKSDIRLISNEAQKQLLMLYRPESTGISSGVLEIARYIPMTNVQLEKVEALLQTWKYNCFEHSEAPLGFSTYFLASFFSHSCTPNAIWNESPTSGFSLRARRPISPGEEISISYIPEDNLVRPAAERRQALESTKSFVCQCERCTSEQPVEISSMENKLKDMLEDKIISEAHAVLISELAESLSDSSWVKARAFGLLTDFCLAKRNSVSQALAYARRRLSLFLSTLGEKDRMNAALAWSLEEVGDLEIANSNFQVGLEELNRARDILITLFGEDDSNVQAVESKIQKIVSL